MRIPAALLAVMGVLAGPVWAREAATSSGSAVIVWLGELKDKEPASRAEAKRQLVQAGPALVPALVEAVKGEDPIVGIMAAEVLGQIGRQAAEAVPDLKAIARDRLTPDPLRNAIHTALRKILVTRRG